MAASSYFIPRKRSDRRAWLVNLKDGIATWGAAVGLSPTDITAVQATCSAQIALIDAVVTAESALQGAQEAEVMGDGLNITALKEEIAKWKTNSGYTSQIGAELRIVGSTTAFDADNYTCEYTVKIIAGEIRIDWKKKGVQAVHIYSRLAGQSQWTLLGMDTSSPYIDGRPLAQAGIAETREYMIRGVMNDVEIGHDSAIQSITWNGQ